MSYLSDPDRLERQAHYVLQGESLPREVAEALCDAAEQIRWLQDRLEPFVRPSHLGPPRAWFRDGTA